VTRRRGWPDHPAIGELADGVRTRLGVSPNHASFRVGALRTHLLTAVFAHAVAARLNTTAHVLLRCDDTDARRTDPAHLPRLIDELTTVAAIPLVTNDAHAVPRQRRRQSRYRAALAALRELGVTKSLGDVIHLDVAAADAVLRSRSDEQIATMRARVINGPGGQRSHPSALVPLTRADGSALWHLATVVDDLEFGINLVVRGTDKINALQIQERLRALLAPGRTVVYLFLPRLVEEEGRPIRVAHLIETGVEPAALRWYLAEHYLAAGPPPRTFEALVSRLRPVLPRPRDSRLDLRRLAALHRKMTAVLAGGSR
jgi:Glutamyl- and glutaminyl-tRNA synthetases